MPIAESSQRFFQQDGFASTGAAHDVETGNAPFIEMSPIAIGSGLIGVKEIHTFEVDDLVHGLCGLEIRAG